MIADRRRVPQRAWPPGPRNLATLADIMPMPLSSAGRRLATPNQKRSAQGAGLVVLAFPPARLPRIIPDHRR
jgi:hypothetical protein